MKHTPGPWEKLLAIVKRIDGTPYDVLSNGPDILISLNCWLMDYEDIDPQQADAAPELLEALELVEWGADDHNGQYCPACSIYKYAGHHYDDCKLGRALVRARGES